MRINDELQTLRESEVASMHDAAANMAGIYARLRDDIPNSTATAPNVSHAVRLTRLVDAVFTSTQLGAMQKNDGWPSC